MITYAVQKNRFIKHCPCSPDTVSCGYHNLNLHTGCIYSCSYCILQGYLDNKSPVFYSNFADLEWELDRYSQNRPELRLGTGELSDSLAFDPQTRYSIKIMTLLRSFPGIVFEFKTKSVNIQNLLKSPALKNVLVSWSLNPASVIRREERGTPSLFRRLQALSAVAERGFKVGIHFDPILFTSDWKTLYRDLVRQLISAVDPKRVAWISLGTLRFPYYLRDHIFKYAKSRLFDGELIRGYDGKYRYFKPLRIELFKYLKKEIESTMTREIPVYLCMEDRETWADVFPEIDPDPGTINRLLYQSVFKS